MRFHSPRAYTPRKNATDAKIECDANTIVLTSVSVTPCSLYIEMNIVDEHVAMDGEGRSTRV